MLLEIYISQSQWNTFLLSVPEILLFSQYPAQILILLIQTNTCRPYTHPLMALVNPIYATLIPVFSIIESTENALLD